MRTKVCKICQIEFETKSGIQKCCSKPCSAINQRKLQKDWEQTPQGRISNRDKKLKYRHSRKGIENDVKWQGWIEKSPGIAAQVQGVFIEHPSSVSEVLTVPKPVEKEKPKYVYGMNVDENGRRTS